ncbi:MAG TPA: UDP-glucose 4-epimerase GalE [Candidatus Limnocylindrales bacterium]|jgi:UDP-glucose-4-epimerase GalE|nr:UDP-glucose 4-epimerase GalE [Candidatus Limnocylindrales bacterium]
MRVLVTGGAGYIGSHTVAALGRAGHEPVVLDTLEHGHAAAVGDAPLIVGDAGDRQLVRDLIAARRIEAVIHFAALKSVAASVADPGAYFEANVGGSLALLRALADSGLERLVISSTCAVYGTPDRLPVDETNPLRPENPYGESKLAVERMATWFEAAHGLRTVALRYFNAAGATPDGSNGEDWRAAENLIPIVLQVAAGRRPAVDVYGTDYPTVDGTAVRDYVHVLDLADAHVRALDHLASGGDGLTLNLGTGQGASVREVIATAEAVTGRPIATRHAPRRAGDPAAIWADSGRARAILGWEARHDLHSMLTTAWTWHERHPDGHEPLRSGGDRAVA